MTAEAKHDRVTKPSPPTTGLGIVGIFWAWGAMAFYAPTYFRISPGPGTAVFNVLGVLLITISFGGALYELSKLWRNEAFSYWGTGLVFLVPALGLHLAITFHYLVQAALVLAAKIIIYILLLSGAPFVFFGIPYLFWKSPDVIGPELVPSQKVDHLEAPNETAKTILAVTIVLLNLATAVIKFVTAVIP